MVLLEPVMSPHGLSWLWLHSLGTCQSDWPSGGVQRMSSGEYLNWKARSGLVKVWSLLWPDIAIDSPQKHKQEMIFVMSVNPILGSMHATSRM
jgi:hypothetical protein